MKRQLPLVLYRLLFCAAAFLFAGTVSLFAQETIEPEQNINQPEQQEVAANRPGGGITVDASGVLRRYEELDVGVLSLTRLRAARESYQLRGDVTTSSPMRCISLNRLEKAVANAVEGDGVLTKEMLYLAGIYQITHVFYFSESQDIVIAGPAEAWFPGQENTMIGVTTQKPVIELRHLITALRAYAPGKQGGNIVGCSIDPTPEGSTRLKEFQQQFNGTNRNEFVRGVRESLGMQTVRIDGIPATTHAAQMMVAADYRMKRIALGEDKLAVRGLQTFIDNTVSSPSNALFRWYFTPNYDSVVLMEDRTGMQLNGGGVQLVGANEVLSESGKRAEVSGELDPGSKAFTRSFTRLYPEISRKALVFAQLRNWIDMLICAAHIQREDFYGKSSWSMEFFGDEKRFKLETFPAPKEVEPLVGSKTVRSRGGMTLVAPVGGVVIDAELALDEEHAKSDTDKKIAEQQKRIALGLPDGVWWWDVR